MFQSALKIIESNTLRLSRYDFMDDINEFDYLKQLSKKVSSDIPFSETAHHFADTEDKFRFFMVPQRWFVTCFSANSDDISQWERFAEHGRGVSIAFDKSLLDVKQVQYKDETDALRFIHEKLQQYESDHIGFTNDLRDESKITKQKHFSSEQEFRILQHVQDAREQKYFPKNNTIQPYIELSLPDNAIKEIKLGPRARHNAVSAWRDLVDPYFFDNNANKWRDWTNRDLDTTTVKVSCSSCYLSI